MVGSAEPVNGFLCLKTKKMYVLFHETVGSTEPTDGFLDPAMQETLVLLHETEGSEDPSNGFLCCKTKKMYVLLHETVRSTEPTDGFLDPAIRKPWFYCMKRKVPRIRVMGCCVRPNLQPGRLPCPALPGPAPFCFALDALPRPGVPALPCLPVYSSARFEHCSEPGGWGRGVSFSLQCIKKHPYPYPPPC